MPVTKYAQQSNQKQDTQNNMKKTAKQWLMGLKDEHRNMAIANMEEGAENDEYSCLSMALSMSCHVWRNTPQGYDFWREIFEQISSGTYFDAPQITQESCMEAARKTMYGLPKRMATDEDYDKLIKESNPKDSLGTKKVPLSGMPAPVLLECGLVKLHGDLKYGRYNWRDAGVRSSVYYDACIRHLMAWWEGEDEDPDSGVHHLAHAMTGLAVLRDSQLQGNCKDDRPKPYGNGWITAMNETAKNMIEKHENDK